MWPQKRKRMANKKIFISRPTVIGNEYEKSYRAFERFFKSEGFLPRRLGKSDYSLKAPLVAVMKLMEECKGAIILGYPHHEVVYSQTKGGEVINEHGILLPTPWNQIEGTLAYKLSLLFSLVIIPITFGGIIYLLFRADSLLMFRWADAIGIKPALDNMRVFCMTIQMDKMSWFFFSLPDGLWAYSFTSFMLIVWGLKFSKHSIFWIAIGPILALGGEIGQAFGVVKGTYDLTDLVLCLIGSVLPVIIILRTNKNNNKGVLA